MLAKFFVIAGAVAATLASPLADCKARCARGLPSSSPSSVQVSRPPSPSPSSIRVSKPPFPSPTSVQVSKPPSATPPVVKSGYDSSSWGPAFGFNGYGGFATLGDFDSFYGVGNFDGSHLGQTVISGPEVVCSSEQVTIIQQRLAVIVEMAKKVIVEQVCEVESQVVLFEQWTASLGLFKGDLRRVSGRKVGFDRRIAGFYGEIIGSDGLCTTHDFGFSGHDIGQELVCPSGNDWRDDVSFVSVNDAYLTARYAHRLSTGVF